ncbi:MAG: glycosyltransferase family 39 protein [Saprospiraceae bacterium]|nr:glycosyltransferase family 39 protein [Lewinella sp.]
MKDRAFILYLLPLIPFFFLSGPDLVQRSMYNDGLWYAVLSRNMAAGEGSFWYPQLTETIFPVFHEHPPLVFGLQSLFFTLFGDHLIVERLYTLAVLGGSVFLIVAIWRFLFSNDHSLRKLWFIPLFLWILNEVVYLYYPANILEGTMGLFTLLAVYLMLRVSDHLLNGRTALWITLAGISLVAATLSKGFVGLFPLAFWGIHWLVFQKYSFSGMLLRTSILLAAFGLSYAVLLSFDTAYDSLSKYFDSQVVASIRGERTTYHYRENRLYIVGRLLQILSPALVLTALLLLIGRKQIHRQFFGEKGRWALVLLLIGFSASLPLAISPRQAFYYLLPACPYFPLAMGICIAPIVQKWTELLNLERSKANFVTILIGSLLIGSIAFSFSRLGKVTGRDRAVLHDVQEIGAVVPAGYVIGSRAYTASLVGYLYRLYHISIDTTSDKLDQYQFLILEKKDTLSPPTHLGRRLPLPTMELELYQRTVGGSR